MKKIMTRILALLLCMCLIAPQQFVGAVELNEKTVVDDEHGEDSIDNVIDNTIDDNDGDDTEGDDGDNAAAGEDDTDVDTEGEETGDDTKGDDADDDTDGEETSDGDNVGAGIDEYEVTPLDVNGVSPDGATSAAHGSGSYQLNEVDTDYRFYTEYYVKADTKKSISSAGIDRRTAIKVYAKAGEIIYFGSSVSDSQIDENNQSTGSVTGKDIVITTPDGFKISKDVISDGEGYIKNHTQEKNGPMISAADEAHPNDYYEPLKYEVPSTGVYTFEFHSVTGFNPNSASSTHNPKPRKANEEWFQGNTSVAAWDITVLEPQLAGDPVIKPGRAWADYLALTTAEGNQTKSDLDVHVLSHDGYLYRVNFKETVPFGFIFFANNTGFMSAVTDEENNTSYHPIYHSFYDSTNDLDHISDENIYLHKPNEPDTDSQETYKIFFNAPSSDLNGVTYNKNGKDETIKTSPDTSVNITGLKFRGIGENVARTGHGGYFTFHSDGEAMVTIRLDLRKAILESEGTMDAYEGSGIVEITTPAVKNGTGEVNSVYWNGKDTDGITLPAGIYGNNNVALSTEIKRGELHFPVIDMEGLYGGLTVQRMNGAGANPETNTFSDDCFDLYYNNNPLAYGTIEGLDYSILREGDFNKLSDGTKSYRISIDKGGISFFKYGLKSVSTMVKDDKEYLAKKMFNTSYSSLTPSQKAIIDAEYGKEQDTFHLEAVDSRTTTMKFSCSGYNGGGNQAGIDAWTYYTQGIQSQTISFALMDTQARGLVSGQIFYDSNISSSYDVGDSWLSGLKVRLIDSQGKPLVHKESLPCFDASGHFIYNPDGSVKHEERDVEYVTVTDSTGTYRFTGVHIL